MNASVGAGTARTADLYADRIFYTQAGNDRRPSCALRPIGQRSQFQIERGFPIVYAHAGACRDVEHFLEPASERQTASVDSSKSAGIEQCREIQNRVSAAERDR